MIHVIKNSKKHVRDHKKSSLEKWTYIILLIILGYEAAGCLLGSALLLLVPNGSYMNMRIAIMHATFGDFVTPGLILLGLGALNTMSFLSLLRHRSYSWIIVGIALCGMALWFLIEIAIIQRIYWLHIIWGVPLIVGLVIANYYFLFLETAPRRYLIKKMTKIMF